MFKSGKKESHVLKLSKNVAAGSAAGVVTLCFVYSLDYARTRLANDTQSGTRQFNGFFDVYRKTLKTDGVVGLYRGFIIASVFVFVYRGLYFGLYDTLKPVLFGEDAGLLSTFALGYGKLLLIVHFGTLMPYPDSKVHGANMGPTWVLSAPDGPHVGPMNLAIRV